MRVVGVDGCKAGWLAVILEDAAWELVVYTTMNELWAANRQADLILVDMPIGLPEHGERGTDSAARKVLGTRRSTVFNVPTRAAIYAEDYAKAREINEQITGKKFSKQLWNIVPKIREVDTLLRREPEAPLRESHPEVVFWGMNGKTPIPHAKREELGFLQRLSLLDGQHGEAGRIIEQGMTRYARSQVARDDLVDALALAVTARRTPLRTLPENPARDGVGLPMEIVYYAE